MSEKDKEVFLPYLNATGGLVPKIKPVSKSPPFETRKYKKI